MVLQQAQDAFAQACSELGVTNDLPEVLSLNKYVAVISHGSDSFAHLMIKIEGKMREKLNAPIDLQMESREDRNKRIQRTGRRGNSGL